MWGVGARPVSWNTPACRGLVLGRCPGTPAYEGLVLGRCPGTPTCGGLVLGQCLGTLHVEGWCWPVPWGWY